MGIRVALEHWSLRMWQLGFTDSIKFRQWYREVPVLRFCDELPKTKRQTPDKKSRSFATKIIDNLNITIGAIFQSYGLSCYGNSSQKICTVKTPL